MKTLKRMLLSSGSSSFYFSFFFVVGEMHLNRIRKKEVVDERHHFSLRSLEGGLEVLLLLSLELMAVLRCFCCFFSRCSRGLIMPTMAVV